MELAGECGLTDMRKGQGQRAFEIREVDILFLQGFPPIFFIGFSKRMSSFPTSS